MATGDSDNIRARLQSLIPGGWYSTGATNRNAIFGGLSDAFAWVYQFIGIAKLQTRIATATGWFLDLIADDFFGLRIQRRVGEPDAAFRARIIKEIFRERATRKGVVGVLSDLTGQTPQLFEPWNPGDVGGYGDGSVSIGGSGATPDQVTAYGFDGYGQAYYGLPGFGPGGSTVAAGCLGSLELPNQIFIIAYRPTADFVSQFGVVSDDEIYASVAATTAAGVTSWVWIQDALPTS